jgi:hypothetical protein
MSFLELISTFDLWNSGSSTAAVWFLTTAMAPAGGANPHYDFLIKRELSTCAVWRFVLLNVVYRGDLQSCSSAILVRIDPLSCDVLRCSVAHIAVLFFFASFVTRRGQVMPSSPLL